MQYDKKGPSSPSGGVMGFPIETRFVNERHRLAGGFTDEDRAWRNKFLKDQKLSPREPFFPDWYYKERYNPIRRFYRFPLNAMYYAMEPVVGHGPALFIRTFTGKVLMALAGLYIASYQLKYHRADWMHHGSFNVTISKDYVPLGSPNFPRKEDKLKPQDFHDLGFKNSPI